MSRNLFHSNNPSSPALMTPGSVPEDELRLCDFCSSIDWTQIATGPFNPGKAALQIGQIKSGEHNLGLIRSAATTCGLCDLIGGASKALKPWWPIGHLLDQPEQITCAFWSGRNRLGSSVQARNLSQVDTLLDMLYASQKPGYSTTELVRQQFFDELTERGIHLGEKENDITGSGNEKRRNSSLNRLLVLAGISPVDWKAQTFMQLHPCLYPVPSVDDYVTGEGPFSAFPTGRIMRPEANVRLLRMWYETCLNHHGETCRQPPWLAPDASWPARFRLIDVCRSCLVEAPGPCPYFALSYVWGEESNPFQTTESAVENMKMPGFFEKQALPKTIVDAMELTKEMGVDFLWVDRLCIIQDSDADKAVQIPQMDLVYSRAAMTIVAASGTAVDGLAGINGTSRTINQRTARVAKDLSFMNVLRLDQAYEDSRWTTRGWTFQEGLCSRRALIITSDHIFWSCESAKCCESIAFEAFPTTVAPNDIIFQVLTGHKVFGEFGGGNNFAYSELDGMIRGYCNRKLGVQSDALDAFTGVLKLVSFNTGHEFHWGHSVSARFDESLAWCNIVWYRDHEWEAQDQPARRRELHRVRPGDGVVRKVQFPSWSWLGWKGVLGVTRAAPRQLVLEPELNIMKLGVNGKAAPLRSPSKENKIESVSKIDMCGVDRSTSAGWKGSTAIDPSLIHRDAEDGQFEDSGRLLFWTSHAVLDIEDDKIYDDKKEQVGELKPFRPNQAEKPTGKHSFIVVSRKHNDDNTRILKAERRLNILLVEWDDPAGRVASRICSGDVDEEAWVKLGEKREWILVTLA
ncbi:HET-domain-containing protein [Hypomontagnella submonticulosa]|nr:HET-domain-containing protein [Hypomontagnella submonticulosa]